MDASATAFDLLRRAWRPGEAALFLDGVPEAATTEAERALRGWSFVAVRPTAGFCVREGVAWRREGNDEWRREGDDEWRRVEGDPWDLLRAFLRGGAPVAGVPFPHGAAGLLSYDAGRLVERIPAKAMDDAKVPEILLHRFDAVWAVPARGAPTLHHAPGADALAAEVAQRAEGDALPFEGGALGAVEARTSPKEFEAMVLRAKAHVALGDVFQVNLSHRLEADVGLHPLELYGRLRERNPAPFSAFFSSGPLPDDPEGFHVLSSSPERLFRLEAGRLEARPIAGTRRRGRTPEEDAALKAELLADPKERAEHVMLVDLARNDLGRVARFGSVRVPHLLTVETYRTVHHLVSVVEADLAEGKDVVDALKALFPGGTITGAPKVRSMEVIEDIEPVRRGVYTGSLGWVNGRGDADFNILIRTLFLRGGRVHLQVGAGIVEESAPEREYQETRAKAQGLLRALGAEDE